MNDEAAKDQLSREALAIEYIVGVLDEAVINWLNKIAELRTSGASDAEVVEFTAAHLRGCLNNRATEKARLADIEALYINWKTRN